MLSNSRRKVVYCVELDRKFRSYREAERVLLSEYNIKCSHASISNVCLGKTKSCGIYLENNKPAKLHFINTYFTPTTTE